MDVPGRPEAPHADIGDVRPADEQWHPDTVTLAELVDPGDRLPIKEGLDTGWIWTHRGARELDRDGLAVGRRSPSASSRRRRTGELADGSCQPSTPTERDVGPIPPWRDFGSPVEPYR